MSKLDFRTLPEPASRYKIGLKIGGGVGGEVYEAVDNQTGKKVAIKMINAEKEALEEVQQEYRVLKQFSDKDNFPEFYGIYGKRGRDDSQKIWLVMEYCDGGDATSLVRKLQQENKQMKELHIAYILRETIKAVIALHGNETTHRDIRGSNILFTADGRVKLVDFGISKRLDSSQRMKTCIGSPGWVAPEVIANQTGGSDGYDQKADVWALGITAIELADGRTPFEDMHPGRALFQIINNPPPTLRKPSEWSQLYNDFIGECLVKNPENRPYVQEFLLHPFFEPLDKEENLLRDFRALIEKYRHINLYRAPEMQVRNGYTKTELRSEAEKILEEDLAAMAKVSEDSVLFQLHERLKKNEIHTFIGDILLILNSNKISDEYGMRYYKKYRFKAKSQNAPHIYSIADSAYRDMFHHEKPQHIIFSGETGAGKTANMTHAMDQLLFLGQGLKSSEQVTKALVVIRFMGNAATPHNSDSTRHVLQTQLTFTETGKTSGAVFRMYLLEKERITMTAKKQANFHSLYCFYNGLRGEGKLAEFHMEEGNYKFLKLDANGRNPEQDASRFQLFENNLRDLGFEEEHVLSVRKILAAVLLLGEIEFLDDEDGNATLATPEIVHSVAALLGADHKKLLWSLLNYCLIVSGEAIMRRNSKHEAEEAKSAMARGLYSRLVDWVVNRINHKISLSRVIYGDKHVVSLLDYYGFECFKRNTLNQLFVNTINEQFQFHYNQQIFALAKQSAEEEEIPTPNLEYNDNRVVVDLIMSKPEGLLHKIDEATRNEDSSNFLDNLQTGAGAPILPETSREFSINHYTGKLIYDASDMVEKNRDFLPPEIIDTMRLSTQDITKQMFSSLISKSGNLSTQPKKRSSANLLAPADTERVSTTPLGQYSQSRQMRTAATTFRAACADLFRTLNVRGSGFHFVRCMRTDLSGKPGAFDPEVVRQQLRALSVVNTALQTQQGYSYSVPQDEFIRRYKFLAFDFDENVEETKENCRLLLLRLKLEGWAMGKTKVFLKYFNTEYLSRLYETQIKKIVKVQSMMRAFMARRKLCAKIRKYQIDADEKKNVAKEESELEAEEKAARIIQKRFREYAESKYNLTEEQKTFLWPWYKRWRTKSIFQVLLLYRAERLQVLANFCLQIHMYNQEFLMGVQRTKGVINAEDLNVEAEATEFLPPLKPIIPKLPFSWDDLNRRGLITDCEPLPDCDIERLELEVRSRLSEKTNESRELKKKSPKNFEDKEIQTSLSKEDYQLKKEEEAISDSKNITKKIQDHLENPSEEQKVVSNSNIVENAKPSISETTKPNIPKRTKLNIPQRFKLSTTEEEKPNISEETKSNVPERTKLNIPEKFKPSTPEKAKLNIPERTKLNTSKDIKLNISDKTASPAESNKIDQKSAISKSHTLPSSIKSKSSLNENLSPSFMLSLNEMEEKFRNKDYTPNGDDPPFNFRALLRKTNPSATSHKSLKEELDFGKEIRNFRFSDGKISVLCGESERPSEVIRIEIAPGVLIYGKVADL